MPSLRGAARALTTTLRRHRRLTRAVTVGILAYVLLIAMTGGIDVTFGPLYELSGQRFESLRASALLLNVGCLAATLAIVRRRGGPTLLLTASVGLGLHLLRVNDMLVSPWNPHLLLLPLALLFVSCAAVLDRRPQFAVVAMAAAAFVVQTHLSVTPTVAALMAATFAVVLARIVAGPDAPVYRRWLNLALWTGLALWLLPLAQELAAPKGNLTAIYEFFLKEPQPGPITRESYAAFFHTLSSFLMPGFATAWGGVVVRSVTWPGFIVAIATLVALPWTATHFSRQGNRFGASLAMLLLGASLVALVVCQPTTGGWPRGSERASKSTNTEVTDTNGGHGF